MQYTRRELLDMALDFVGENDDPNARNTAERLLNIALQNIWSKMAWQQFAMPTPYTFETKVGVASYPLPAYFGRVRGGQIRNVSNGTRINPSTLEQLDLMVPGRGTSLDTPGMPEFYAIGGTVGVQVQVQAAGEIVSGVSDDNTDTAVRVGVAGLDEHGWYRRTQTALMGVVPVSLGLWMKVIEVSKAYPGNQAAPVEWQSSMGNVVVSGAVSGVLVTLSPEESAIERIEMTLWPTPAIVNIISVPVLRRPMKLLFDSDVTPLGWGPALLEEMHQLWMMNSGQAAMKQSAGPALLDLIAFENSARFDRNVRVRP